MPRTKPPIPKPKKNVWWEKDGIIFFDASTKKHQNIIGKISKQDEHLLTDGKGKWVAWGIHRARYIVRRCEGKVVYMHRVILDAGKGVQVDHISGEAFDNTRENIRLVTDAENKRNMPKPSHNTTGICGVTFCRRRQKYVAQMHLNGKMIYLGEYKNIDDAAKARKQADIRYGFHENHGR